jgi:hypothetical protein
VSADDEKRAAREVAARIEQGIERYSAGDLRGAAAALEEALRLAPGNEEAGRYLAWVRQLQAGRKKIEPDRRHAVDADLIQVVTDALAADDDVQITVEPPVAEAVVKNEAAPADSPWDPVPLTPTGSGGGGGRAVTSSSPPQKRSSSTLLGLNAAPSLVPPAPPREPTNPGSPRPRLDGDETGERRGGGDFTTSAGTRRWGGTTGVGLPPLEVPELTEEQIHELIALDGSPYLTSGTSSTGGTDARPTEARGPAPAVIELEAEPPDDAVSGDEPVSEHDNDDPTKGWAPRLLAIEDDLGGGFDEGEETPTRDRSELLRQVSGYPRRIGDTIRGAVEQVVPFDDEGGAEALPPPPARAVAPSLGESDEDDATSEHPAARRPGSNITSEQPVLAPIEPLETALERGDGEAAFHAAEEYVAESGGIESQRCRDRSFLLQQAYELAVGRLDAVPAHGRLVGELDPRGAFLLSRIDGMSSADDLLEVSGMPRLEALRLLAQLLRRGAIVMR